MNYKYIRPDDKPFLDSDVEVERIFTDNYNDTIRYSERPGMKELLQQVQPGDNIYVPKAYMLTRNCREHSELLKLCIERNVNIIQLDPELILTKVFNYKKQPE